MSSRATSNSSVNTALRRRRAGAIGAPDQAEEVAAVARARRDLLLRVHRFRLGWEDLEDCYSQATLELVAYARRGGAFASRRHIANVVEQRFLSRVSDRRRAISGRSPMQAQLAGAASLDLLPAHAEAVDHRADIESLVLQRHELRRILDVSSELSGDQRLVLASQLAQMEPAAFCARVGWSAEKYRKVAQRARAKLRTLVAEDSDDL